MKQCDQFEVLSQHSPRGTSEMQENLSIVGVLAEI
jgi:hypothetical protein